MTRFSEIDKDTMDFLLQTVPQSPAYLQPRHNLHDIAVACYAELKDELKARNAAIRIAPAAKGEPVVATTADDNIAAETSESTSFGETMSVLEGDEKPRRRR